MNLQAWTPSVSSHTPVVRSFIAPTRSTGVAAETPAAPSNGHSGENVVLSNAWAPPTVPAVSTEPPKALASQPTVPQAPAYQPPAGTNGPLLMDEAPVYLPSTEGRFAAPAPALAWSSPTPELDRQYQASVFNHTFKEAGWTMREGVYDHKFMMRDLEGREVAFQKADENGNLVEHRGVLTRKPGADPMSAMFGLQGQEGEFNSNFVGEMALRPLEPKPPAAAGPNFQSRYEEAGWKVREKHGDTNYWASALSGREVAFVTYGADGRPVEHRGLAETNGDFMSAVFTLRDQPGSFNANMLVDVAVRPRQPEEAKPWGMGMS